MTIQQICMFTGLYLVVLAVVTVITRATLRRFVGALAGAAVAGAAISGSIAIGGRAGWWHFVLTWEPYYLRRMRIGVIPCGVFFLVSRRFAPRVRGPRLAPGVVCFSGSLPRP